MKQEKISFSFTFKKEGKCDERIEQREEEKKNRKHHILPLNM
jgi:hypothetical protein